MAIRGGNRRRLGGQPKDHSLQITTEMVAAGAPLRDILEAIVKGIEAQRPGMLCSILLVDEDSRRLRLGAAPSLPDFYNAAVDGLEIGRFVGSCGTAAFTGRRVVVADISSNPLWTPWAEIAARARLGSCWSEPITDSAGQLLGTFAMYQRKPSAPTRRDIGAIAAAAHLAAIAIERDRAAAALAASERRGRQALEERALLSEIAGVGLWAYDPRTDSFEWSGEWLRALIGPDTRMTTAEQFLGLCHPDDHETVILAVTAAAEHGANGAFDHRLHAAAGGWVWMRVHLRAEPASGGLHRVLGISQEITQLAEARREAEAQAQRLKVALKAAKAAVVEIDYVTETIWHSPIFGELIGRELTYHQAIHAAWHFMHPEDAPAIRSALKRWFKGEDLAPLELRIRRPDGAERWVRICTELETAEDGRWLRSISLILDIDDRKRQELALVAAERAAQAAGEAKSNFLANMSHEIRTPLNGVLAMTELMGQGELDPEQRDRLDVVHTSGKELLRTINDILDFSKLESGRLQLDCVCFDIQEALDAVLANARLAALEKGLALELEIAPDARGLRQGDRARLSQIVGNLVCNALKFTAEGRVRVSAAGLGQCGGEGVRISVRDTGIGIAEDKIPLLFQKFSQVDPSTTRRFGGSGLGLAICQELAGLMGGKVSVESEPGVGSCFSVSLDLPRVAASSELQATATATAVAAAAEAPGVETPRLRILAAEDNATNQMVLKTIIEIFGGDLTLVENGRDAVEAWRAGQFDMILMDLHMPVMDGIEATRAIRRLEVQSDIVRTPIIALSANVFMDQVDGCIAAGMDGHVAKPIDLSALQAAMEAALASEGQGPGRFSALG
jgi:signal transduction histidine kinase/GAF domain-containing protein/ActR/RegA family two-component response regulator